MVRSSEEALKAALAQSANVPGTCQATTRGWFDAPSAGDVDHDGDADARDGWLSEPVSARHKGDRNPPAGKPLYFSKNNGKGFGHRCISLNDHGGARSTDMDGVHYRPGHVGNTTIAAIELAMKVVYIGWSETIDGQPIPPEPVAVKPAPKPAPKQKQRPAPVRAAIKAVKAAITKATGPVQKSREQHALDDLRDIKKR